MRFGFAGTPEFAVPTLRALLAACAHSDDQVVAVWTQPDRPAGRGRKVSASPVKRTALEHNIDVLQPRTLRAADAQQTLAALNLDLLVVVAYGLILPAEVLSAPRFGCVNVHASLLPRWRGAAPIQRCIAAGDTVTGVGIMQMEAGLDTGPLWRQASVPIDPTDTGGSLHDTLAALGAAQLVAALDDIAHGMTPRPQDPLMTTYAHKLTKSEALIDWQRSAEALHDQVRAFNPWPVAHTTLRGTPLRVLSAQVRETQSTAPPGTVVDDTDGIAVACGHHVLVLEQVQLAGGKPMPARAFVNARAVRGEQLGAPA